MDDRKTRRAKREDHSAEIKELIGRIMQLRMPPEELLQCLDSPYMPVVTNAILAVVRLKASDDQVVEKLAGVASQVDASHHWYGWKNPVLALAALYWLGTAKSLAGYEELLPLQPPGDRKDAERLSKQGPPEW